MTIFNIIILYPQGEKALERTERIRKKKKKMKNTKRKHLKLCLLLLFMALDVLR